MWSYYAFWLLAPIAIAIAVAQPAVLAVVVIALVARRWLPDPVLYLRSAGRVNALQQQIELNPANATARAQLAEIWLAKRRPRRAIPLLEQALQRDAGSAELRYLLGLAHLRRFPEFAAHAQAPHHPDEDKSLILLNRLYGERMVRQARIHAIVLVRVADRARTVSRPATKSEAMLWLAPSSLMLMTGAGPRAIDVLARLVERTPCRWLELGRDMESIPDRVADVLTEAA